MKYCIVCRKAAEYVIQWGPKVDQKEYACGDHVPDLLKRVPAIEFFVVKIEKVN